MYLITTFGWKKATYQGCPFKNPTLDTGMFLFMKLYITVSFSDLIKSLHS